MAIRISKKIGLLDHMGGGNLGDDATQTAVIHNIRKRWPDSVICAFSMNPSDTESRHGIPSYPIRVRTWDFGGRPDDRPKTFKQAIKSKASRYGILYKALKIVHSVFIRKPRTCLQELRFLVASIRILRSFDVLVISGGGQLLDLWGGPWGFPYTLFKWVALAKIAKVKCIVLNVGAGPIDRPKSKYFIKTALHLADYVSFRDSKSLALARKIGFRDKAQVFPDCVYGLGPTASNGSRDGEYPKPLVGIAPMAYGDQRVYPENDPTVYSHLIQNLGLFSSWLVNSQYDLALFCSDIGVDPPAIEDLKALIQPRPDIGNIHHVSIPALKSGADLLLQISSMDYVVTCRFHGVVFAHLLNRPVLAISHHPKIVTLMADLGLSEYCLDIHQCESDVLIETFMSLVRNGPAIKKQMADKLELYQSELSSQFDELFSQDRNMSMLRV